MALHTADEKARAAVLAAGAVLVAGTAALCGCMEQKPPPPPGQPAQASPGEGFFLNREDDRVSLAYGRANSDDVRLMLECRPGGKEIEITDAGHRDARKGEMLVLTSGKMQSALPATVAADAEGGGNLAVAHADPALPALDGFRRTGALSVKLGAREYALNASGTEKALIARFFSACERK
jgi:hypothetical protein